MKAIVIPDLQVPYHDKKSLANVERYMADHKWDYYINLGDFLDYFCISRFNEGKPGLVAGKEILDEVRQGEEILDRHISIVKKNNPKAKFIYLQGNHEYRATDFVYKNPQLRGIIEPEPALKLKEKGVKYVKSWETDATFKLGKAYFAHGNRTNIHHAKKMVEEYGENVFYGHTHDCNSFYLTTKGKGKTRVGQSLGHLSKYPAGIDYMKGTSDNWQQAFGVFHFRDNGFFNHFVVTVNKHSFISPEGKLYA